MGLKNLEKVGIVLFILFTLVILENVLRLKKGLPSVDSDPHDFYYTHVEIYKKFFRKSSLDDEKVIFISQRSGSHSKTFSASKAKGTKRIFVIGGSVSLMFNEDVVLQGLLGDLASPLNFEVIGCGRGGYDSYRESLILNEVVNYSPDLIIIMSGNNEFFYPVRLNLFAYRYNKFLRRFWIYRLLQERIVRHSNNFRYTQKSSLVNFENNLKKMIHIAKKKKIPIALCTLPANFSDCPPAGNEPLEEKGYFQARYSFSKGNFEEARERFKQFLRSHPEDAFGSYFLAQCYDKLGDYLQAKNYYLKALTLDANPGSRCPPQRNAAIRKFCKEEDIILIDLEKTFIEASPNQLVGSNLFVDNCHWWTEGNYLVYKTIIESISIYNSMHSRPVFHFSQDKEEFLLKNLKEWAKESQEQKSFRKLMYGFSSLFYYYRPNTLNERALSFIKAAYQLDSNLFVDKNSLKDRVIKELRVNHWAEELLSNINNIWPNFLYHIGETYLRLCLYNKAIEYFDEAIAVSESDFWSPFLGRGIAYYKVNKLKEAKEDFYKAEEKSKGCSWVKFYKEALGII